MFKKVRRYARDPYYALGYDLIKKYPRWMSDKFFIKVEWKMLMGYKLDLSHPQTFNEKLQWLKLYDHKPLYSTLVDKYRVKEYVAKKIGAEHVIPTLAVYQSVNEIDLNELPNRFVLKCNHDSGSVVICRDKTTFDFAAAKQKLERAIKRNFYWEAREWAYKYVKPVIFAEQYMEDTHQDNETKDLLTYKFICCDGKPQLMYITVKNEDVWEDYFDLDYEPLDIMRDFRHSNKPKTFEKMKEIAATLSQGIPQVRMDLYEANGEVYFSEFTFYDWGGYAKFRPTEWDKKLGDAIQLKK